MVTPGDELTREEVESRCLTLPDGDHPHIAEILAHDAALRVRAESLREALEGMMWQFAYWSDDAGGFTTGGLSALETAFELLGWEDPRPCPEGRCDESGCMKRSTCGIPTSAGYRRVCGDHYRAIEEVKK